MLALSMSLTCFAPSALRELRARLHAKQKTRLGACFLPKASEAGHGHTNPKTHLHPFVLCSLALNKLNDEAARYLSDALRANTALKELKCVAFPI